MNDFPTWTEVLKFILFCICLFSFGIFIGSHIEIPHYKIVKVKD